jgi:hypothetical protein
VVAGLIHGDDFGYLKRQCTDRTSLNRVGKPSKLFEALISTIIEGVDVFRVAIRSTQTEGISELPVFAMCRVAPKRFEPIVPKTSDKPQTHPYPPVWLSIEISGLSGILT